MTEVVAAVVLFILGLALFALAILIVIPIVTGAEPEADEPDPLVPPEWLEIAATTTSAAATSALRVVWLGDSRKAA